MGDWNDADNWTCLSAPNADDASVIFGSAITANATVVTDTAVTVRGISFDNANRYAIAGTGALTLADGVSATPLATIQVVQGAHEFQLPVTLGSAAQVDVTGAADELIFNNALNLGGFQLEKVGAGTMSVNNDLTTGGGGEIVVTEGSLSGVGTVGGSLTVSASATVAPGNSIGTLNVESDLTLSDASIYEWEIGQGGRTDTINITGGAVDLDNFVLTILDADGYVASETVQLPVFIYDAGTTTIDMIGFINDAANFDTTGLDGTWTVGALALTDGGSGVIYLTGLSGGNLVGAMPGDADNDGKVDHLDLVLFNEQFGLRGSHLSCDFNNDDVVGIDDLAILRANFGWVLPTAPGAGDGSLPTGTPEPATLSLLTLGGLAVLRRRRKQ